MVLIATLDSSLLSLPEINDYLVVARCYKYPERRVLFSTVCRFGIGDGLPACCTRSCAGEVRRFCVSVSTRKIFNVLSELMKVWSVCAGNSGDLAAAVTVQNLCSHGGDAGVPALEILVDDYDCSFVSLLR